MFQGSTRGAASALLAAALLAAPVAGRADVPAGEEVEVPAVEATPTPPPPGPEFDGDVDGEAEAAAEVVSVESLPEHLPPPYAYPSAAAEVEPSTYPAGAGRIPAAAVDLLIVRPQMLAGLVAGAGLFVATLPITAATLRTDEQARALVDQAADLVARPPGDF